MPTRVPVEVKNLGEYPEQPSGTIPMQFTEPEGAPMPAQEPVPVDVPNQEPPVPMPQVEEPEYEQPASAQAVTVEQFQALMGSVDRLASMVVGMQMEKSQQMYAQPVVSPQQDPMPPKPEQKPESIPAVVSTQEQKQSAKVLLDMLEADDRRIIVLFCQEQNVSDVELIRAALTSMVQTNALRDQVRRFIRYSGSGRANVQQEGCPECHLAFHPSRPGQQYCCNACGARALGKKPVVAHAPDCPTGYGQEIPVIWGTEVPPGIEPMVRTPQIASPYERIR